MLQSMGLQRVRHDWGTELNWRICRQFYRRKLTHYDWCLGTVNLVFSTDGEAAETRKWHGKEAGQRCQQEGKDRDNPEGPGTKQREGVRRRPEVIKARGTPPTEGGRPRKHLLQKQDCDFSSRHAELGTTAKIPKWKYAKGNWGYWTMERGQE